VESFDWRTDRPPAYPIEDILIYEMHVRGFARHPSSGVQHPGTFDSRHYARIQAETSRNGENQPEELACLGSLSG
jgi:hypothetical protein